MRNAGKGELLGRAKSLRATFALRRRTDFTPGQERLQVGAIWPLQAVRGVRISGAEALAVRLWEACGIAVEKAYAVPSATHRSSKQCPARTPKTSTNKVQIAVVAAPLSVLPLFSARRCSGWDRSAEGPGGHRCSHSDCR
jgi:hypothetical protein